MTTAIAFAAVLSSTCSPSPSAPPSDALHARFVLLAQSPQGRTVAFARTILKPGYHCPRIIGGENAITMTPRDNPHGFPVAVCEAEIPFESDLQIETDGAPLPLPTVTPIAKRITVLGDTGCKTAECPLGQPAQPFASMAQAASRNPRDLIVHVGDYNYRGTGGKVTIKDPATGESVTDWAYDAGDGTKRSENCLQAADSGFVSQNAPGSDRPDAWEYWRDDFFTPAGELLASAPWIFARGNHELCSRAGPGWFYFLDASSNLPSGGGRQISCPAPRPKSNPIDSVVLPKPYRIELGPLHLIVVDSSNACDAFVTDEMRDFSQAFTQQLVEVGSLTVEDRETWLVTHRPFWGVQQYWPETSSGCSDKDEFSCINRTLEYALDKGLGGTLPQGVRLLLSGHMHRFQSLTFPAGGRPAQLIVGNGGTHLEGGPPLGRFSLSAAGVELQGVSTGEEVQSPNGKKGAYGFLEIDYSAQGWKGILSDPADSLQIVACGSQLQEKGSVCELSPGIEANSP